MPCLGCRLLTTLLAALLGSGIAWLWVISYKYVRRRVWLWSHRDNGFVPSKDDIQRFYDEYNRLEDMREELMHGKPPNITGLHP